MTTAYSNHRSSAAQNKSIVLPLFDDKKYSYKNVNLDDDDATVITGNLLNKSVYSGSYRHDRSTGSGCVNGGNGGQSSNKSIPRKQMINKKRAPLIAAFLMISFFVIGGIYFVTKSIGAVVSAEEKVEEDGKKLSSFIEGIKINTSSGNNSNTNNSTFSIKGLMEEMSKPNLDMNGNPIRLPPQLANLADINAPYDNSKEVAILWHIPRTGGSSFKKIASFCYDLTLASEVGIVVDPVAATKNELMIVVDADSGTKFLNVDTTSPEGLERAKSLDVASYTGLDLITTPYIFPASEALFNALNRGRFIVMFRHPIDRAVSMYYYLRDKTGIRGAQIGETLELYAKSSAVENNWMTRFLTNKLGGQLSPDDEATAKEVLRKKCLVGLLGKKTESMRRFKEYFGWNVVDGNQENQDCEEKLLHWGWTGKNKHQQIEEGSDTWNLLMEQNSFDIRVYEYAVKLFELQGKTIFSG